MKQIKDIIYESSEWNPTLSSHRDAYNSFCKWYQNTSRYLDDEEIMDMLQSAMREIEDGSLGNMDLR